MSYEETKQLVKFLEGIVEGLMCNVESMELIRGLIVAILNVKTFSTYSAKLAPLSITLAHIDF